MYNVFFKYISKKYFLKIGARHFLIIHTNGNTKTSYNILYYKRIWDTHK